MYESQILKLVHLTRRNQDYRYNYRTEFLNLKLSELELNKAHPSSLTYAVDVEGWLQGLHLIATENPLLAISLLNESTLHSLTEHLASTLLSPADMSLVARVDRPSVGALSITKNTKPTRALLFSFKQSEACPLVNLGMHAQQIPGLDLGWIVDIADLSTQSLIDIPLLLHQEHLRFFLLGASSVLLTLLSESCHLLKNYSQHRIQGGRSLVQWPLQREQISDLFAKMHLFEKILKSLLQLTVSEQIFSTQVFLAELVEQVPNLVGTALRLFGGNGYMMDNKIEFLLRASHFLSSQFGSASTIRAKTIAFYDLENNHA